MNKTILVLLTIAFSGCAHSPQRTLDELLKDAHEQGRQGKPLSTDDIQGYDAFVRGLSRSQLVLPGKER